MDKVQEISVRETEDVPFFTLRYLIYLLGSFLLGVALQKYVLTDLYKDVDGALLSFFSSSFRADSFWTALGLFSERLRELVPLLCLYVFSFSSLCAAAGTAVVVLRGVSLGFCIMYYRAAIGAGLAPFPRVEAAFVFYCIVAASCAVSLAIGAAKSEEFRYKRAVGQEASLAGYTLSMLRIFGFTALLHMIEDLAGLLFG